MAGFPKPPSTRVTRRRLALDGDSRWLLYAATALSVAVHALAVGLIGQKTQGEPPARSDSRARSAMLVSWRSVPAAQPVQIARAMPRPLPRPAVPVRRARPPAPAVASRVAPPAQRPLPAPVVASSAEPAPPVVAAEPVAAVSPATPMAPVAPPAAPAASRFAGLFAPVAAFPVGRARWGGAPSSHTAPDPRLQREQAAMALQMALQNRLNALVENMRGADDALSCDIVVDTERQVGEVHCTPASDQAAPWSYLQGLLVAGTVADGAPRFCFRLAERQLLPGVCPGAAP